LVITGINDVAQDWSYYQYDIQQALWRLSDDVQLLIFHDPQESPVSEPSAWASIEFTRQNLEQNYHHLMAASPMRFPRPETASDPRCGETEISESTVLGSLIFMM
jgi:hypothetical protein